MKGKTSGGNKNKKQKQSEQLWQEALSAQDLEQLKATFDLLDEENTGSIDVTEICKLLQQLGLNKRHEHIFQMIEELKQKNKPIVFEQFVELVCGKVGNTKTRAGIERIFKLFDKQGQGQVTLEGFKTIARELGQSITEQEIQQLMHNTHILNKTQSNQSFSFEEFYNIIVTSKKKN